MVRTFIQCLIHVISHYFENILSDAFQVLVLCQCVICWYCVSLTSWGEGASLALVCHFSIVCVIIKMPYGVDVLLNRPPLHPIFSYLLDKTESDFIVRSVKTGLGRWTLVVAVIIVDIYPLGFLKPDLSPWGHRNRCFLVALCCQIVKRPNLEGAKKRLLHQVKILE